jgi:hypothetical protein
VTLRGGAAAAACIVASCVSCTPAAAPPPAVPQKPVAVSFGDDAARLPIFRSKRFSLTLPLPDGAAWRIDDHTQETLVATHAPTRSKVTLAVFRADGLVGRTQCEELSRTRKLVAVPDDLQVLEEQTGITQQTFDTRTLVGVAPGGGPQQPLVGHVMAFGGFLRKCFVFDFATQVDGAADEAVLSSRLAYARARILGGLAIEALGMVEREHPAGAAQPPP